MTTTPDIVLLGLTVVLSVGGSLFASGRYIGKVTEQVKQNKDDIKKNTDLMNELEAMVGRALNNGVRSDIAAVNKQLAGLQSDLSHCREMGKKVDKVVEDVAYMRGQMDGGKNGKPA